MISKMYFGGSDIKHTSYENAKIIILPVPYDGTSTWIKGADKGPDAILEASANMELYDIETDSEVYKKGIHTDNSVTSKSPEVLAEKVRERVKAHLDASKFSVVIGGEHSVSIGAIQAHKEKYPDMCVLQIDAHADLRPEYQGSKYNHACVMSRVRELCPCVQVGIRSMDATEKEFIDENVFFMKDIRSDWIDKVISRLSKNVYLTFDLDALDPSIMPSTGTPEPGGFQYWEILELLKRVIKEKNLIGFDVVELCPNKFNKAPDFLASKLIYKILSYKFEGK